MNELQGGAGFSGASASAGCMDRAKAGSIDHFLYRTQSVKRPKISSRSGMKTWALK